MRNVPLRLLILISLAAGVAWPQRSTGEYAVVLEEAPLAAGAKTAERKAAVANAQQRVSRSLAAAGIRQTGSADLLVNAIFVQATPDQARTIGKIDGVRFVQYLPPFKRAMNRALDLVQGRAAWSQVGGEQNAGAGIKIAVIDSGIDHTHAAFQDASLAVPSGFPKGEAAYTNSKVIVARSYVAQLPFADVRPEDSRPDDTTPRDRVGHGTALAMIAAGRQVQAPLGSITGVAPKAYLGNYKVFGSPGVNDSTRASVLILALQDAIADGMDIAVLSVASPAQFGPLVRDSSCQSSVPLGLNIPQDACDVRAYAIENAVKSGLAVVTAGGNRGLEFEFPALASITTPGTAPAAITVGATSNSHILYSTVRAEGNAQLQEVDAFFGNGPKPAGPVRAPLREVTTFGCEALGANSLAGAIALIPRGTCSYATKVNNAQRAGAVGVIIYQPDGVNGIVYMQALATTGIPAVLVRNRDGIALRDWIRATPSGTVVLDPALREEDAEFDTVADFNSHGPAIGDVTLGEGPIKPELAAVGTDLYVATQRLDPNGELWDPSGYTTAQGTSFAAAMAAGAAALVKQRNPGFTPAQIKSALVNTASSGVRDFLGEARVVAVGAGKLHVDNAVKSNVTVDPPVLSFGVLNPSAAFPKTITLRVTNTASTAQNLTFEMVRRDADSRAQFTVSPSSANLNPGASTDVSVRLAGTRPNPGQYEGFLRIRGGAVELRVPYLYLMSDGIPFDMYAIYGQDFLGVPSERDWYMEAKIIDRHGVPLPDIRAQFYVVSGGGRIEEQLGATDVAGITFARVTLGSTLGEQAFGLRAGALDLGFFGRTRLAPVIDTNGVVNAASGQTGRLAPGSYISIFGSGLAEALRVATTASLPLSLSGVSVSFDAAGLSLPGRLHFVSERQINVQIPWELEGRDSVQMKVSIGAANTETSTLFNVPLATQSPAFFEYDDAGRRSIAALNQQFQLISQANPARKGQAVQLYVNGLGPVAERQPSGEPAPTNRTIDTVNRPTLTIGGRSAQVLFSGLAPGNVGLYQVNAIVPADTPSGAQDVVLTINGTTARTATLTIGE